MHNFVLQDISGLPFQINWTNSAILMTHRQPVILEQKFYIICQLEPCYLQYHLNLEQIYQFYQFFYIFSPGFPKNAYQGCHISESHPGMIFKLVSFCEIKSQNQKSNVNDLGNTIQELFPSRHNVLGKLEKLKKTSLQNLLYSSFYLQYL